MPSFFFRALHTIPLSSPRFWHQVSQAVETRTAQECQSKYEEQLEGRPKKESVRTKQQTKPQQKGRIMKFQHAITAMYNLM